MPAKDPRIYARSEKGIAARAKAHARYIEKRRESTVRPVAVDTAPLAKIMSHWR